MIRPITQMGDPVLCKKAKRIADPCAEQVQAVAADLVDTVGPADGVGLAAPQIGESLRMVIVAPQGVARYVHLDLSGSSDTVVMINPVMVKKSSRKAKDWEGCLSIPGLYGLVRRFESLTVQFLAMDGQSVTREFSGFMARIVQHEMDHLDGVLFLDRMDTLRELVTQKEYIKRVNQP